MKFGILNYSGQGQNIGDFMQLQGILKAYERLGVSESELIKVERNKLADYDGEYVILPMSCFLSKIRGTSFFPLSEKIIPVFLGLFNVDEYIAEQLYAYRHFGPFGCRDLETMRTFRRAGLDAYMSGCLSIGFKKRNNEFPCNQNYRKVFLMDVPKEAYSYIPEDLLEEAEELPSPLTKMKCAGYCEDNEKEGRDLLASIISRVRDEGKLLITSRLHASIPFIAMGVPVITLHKCKEEMLECRFSGLDKLLNCYTMSEYSKIDWNPSVPDIEDIKEKTIQLACQRITQTYDKYWKLCEISDFYESGKQKMYFSGNNASYLGTKQKKEFLSKTATNDLFGEKSLLEYITKKNLSDTHMIVFGAGDKAKWMVRRYQYCIKTAKTFDVVDNSPNKLGKGLLEVNSREKWDFNATQNYIIKEPQIIQSYPKEKLLIIVAADKYYEGAGLKIANELIEKYNFREGKEFFMLDKLNNSMLLPLGEAARPFGWMDVL